MSKDIGSEGGLYSQGDVVYISLGPGDYRNEFLKRGGARAIRWSIRNANGRTTASELPSSCNAAVSFFSSESTDPATRCTKSEAKPVWNPHTHSREKNRFIVTCLSWSILCSSATESVAGTERLPHNTSVLRCHVHLPPGLLMSSAPATRSRTLLFLSYRDSRASSSTSHHRYTLDNDGDENERLIDPTKDHIVIDVGLPPKWSGHPRR